MDIRANSVSRAQIPKQSKGGKARNIASYFFCSISKEKYHAKFEVIRSENAHFQFFIFHPSIVWESAHVLQNLHGFPTGDFPSMLGFYSLGPDELCKLNGCA